MEDLSFDSQVVELVLGTALAYAERHLRQAADDLLADPYERRAMYERANEIGYCGKKGQAEHRWGQDATDNSWMCLNCGIQWSRDEEPEL